MNQHTKLFRDEMYKKDPTQGILDGLQTYTVNLEDLEYMCLHFPLKERTQIRKATLQSGDTKMEAQCIHTHFCKYRMRSIPRSEEIGVMKTVEHKSESRNNHQFAAVVQDLTIQWILLV